MPPRKRRTLALVLLSSALLLALPAIAVTKRARGGGGDPCASIQRGIVVVASDRALWLCEGGHGRSHYPVALGSGGVDKRVAGDRRTPLGNYALGAPRPSASFGTFIPIAYPTAEQRRLGFTGSDVGIHGPKRGFRWAGAASAWVDWTAGCIAVGTDAEIGEVATFVRGGAATVDIR